MSPENRIQLFVGMHPRETTSQISGEERIYNYLKQIRTTVEIFLKVVSPRTEIFGEFEAKVYVHLHEGAEIAEFSRELGPR